MWRFPLIFLFLIGSAGCASIVEGTGQNIFVNLQPPSTVCNVSREGSPLGTVSSQKKNIYVSKSKNDLIFECTAPGYQSQTVTVESSASGWGVAGCFLIDLCITDYSTGALNKYPETVSISMEI